MDGGGAPVLKRCLFFFALLVLLAFLGLAGAVGLAPKPDLWGGADFSRVVTDRSGRVLRVTLTRDEKYRIFTPLERIPAAMREAAILYEDRAFYRHPGVNPLALVRAVAGMAAGGRRMGASTITMQLVRLRDGLDTTTVPGKLRQMWRALVLERHYDKRAVLEAYLNLAPYGGNVEGVGAAARVWFRKDAALLSLPEIMALVPVPQHPAARNPAARRGRALPEARERLAGLWREKYPEVGNLFESAPLAVSGPADLPFEAPHAVAEILARPDLPEGEIVTTLDLPTQRVVERALKRAVARGRVWGMNNAAALLVDWRDGSVRALAGSADFFDAGIQGQVDGTAARRSPGSTLKPFVYALALEQGLIHPLTVLADTPRVFRGYEPENADGEFRGPVSAREALRASRNIPAVALAGRLAPPGLYGFLTGAGVDFPESAEHYGLALVLGGAELSMRELAGLYTALPGRGMARQPVLLPRERNRARRVLSPEAAYVTLDMLRAPSPSGPTPFTACWKTGTSNGRRDAWTVGVIGPYVLAVWVGNFDGAANPGFTGAGAAAPLFFDIARALAAREALPDPLRNREGLNLVRIPVCAATGDLNTALCPEAGGRAETWFIPGVSPIADSGILREILVDRETGLRQCRDIEGRTERMVWEFWPADLRRLFRQAGINKPPAPPFAPECLGGGPPPGRPPVITSPRPGVVYSRSLTRPGPIPLLADTEADADGVFWFAGTRFLGRSGPDEPLLWDPAPGITELRAVDDLGRATSLRVNVETVP
ncbi:MAG: penicillin-binding protein 1C [Desulfovibrionaceae bacterium]|nr:MAG: penicillin-binding protein 1C [Desulfovibrionaceae bacterium]